MTATEDRRDAEPEVLAHECDLWFVLAREAEAIQRTLEALVASLPTFGANGS